MFHGSHMASEAGIHRPHVAGIHGREDRGAFSIVLSGGYEDDVDNGDEFWYTGSGGRDLSGNKRTAAQSSDQKLTRMNRALALNCNAPINEQKGSESKDWKKGKPVRVIRSSKLAKHSTYAPSKGNRYDGIYKVVKYYPEKGKAGFIVWRYVLRRDDPTFAPWTKEGKERINRLGLKLEDMTIPIYCITDNAPNFRSAAKTLFGDKARPCFAHSLQLAVDDSKSECPGVKKLLQKAKNIVGHYRRSSQARERLHSLQERMQVPQLELIQYVETRWSSEYCMLQRLVEMKGPIAAELAQSEHNIEPLTNADWAQAKGVLEVLEPLAQATKEISGDSYPTSSMVIPILHCLSSHLNSRIQRQEEANLSTALRNELYRDFEEMDSTADEPEPSTSNSGLWSFFDSLPNERKEMNISEEVEKYLSEPRYPENYLEAMASKEKTEGKKTPKAIESHKRKRLSSRNSEENIEVHEGKKVRPEPHSLEKDLAKLIDQDINTKLWGECKKHLIEGTQRCLRRSFAAQVYTCPCCRTELGKDYEMEINEPLSQILVKMFPGYTAGRN
uniref:(California timema) hypothetical protein n=1 Tax=Timema californicum TaxID=61474 RepID=A0A7R9PBB4_TIMCA|nr:unnamed protein product [Timema californicum]